jgi:two-component system response regulator AtoC
MPCLRERKEDIPLLTDHFIQFFNNDINKSIKTVPEEIRRAFMAYNWPGNVRELRSTVERAMILSEGEALNPRYILLDMDDANVSLEELDGRMKLEVDLDDSSLEDIEQKIIRKTLEQNNWNQTRAAGALKMNRQNLRYRMKKMGLLS